MTLPRLAPSAIVLIGGALCLAATAGCGGEPGQAPPLTRETPRATASAHPTRTPESIDWDEAVDLITRCEVTFAVQAHSLDVWLTLRDGTEVRTVEPGIDDVFEVVRDAVAGGCEQIPLATE